jgi:uncharacterized protein YycO
MINTDNLRKGDVILVRDHTLSNKAVRLFTLSDWGHVVLYIGDGFYLESAGGGVQIKTVSQLKSSQIKAYRHRTMTPRISEGVVEKALKHEGSRYDWRAVVQLLLRSVFGRRYNPKKIGKNDRWFCSELISVPMKQHGLEVLKGVDPHGIIPADFARSNYFIRIEC